ncbi:MAG: 50S ribosomal protein L35 [Chthonomonadales bacterium]|nr:50S ribosomal protein L35 [Chthonomonadales bacterium]
MAKIRTKKTVAKRFKVSGGGKLMRRSVGLNHLMRKKTKSRRRKLTKGVELFAGDGQRMIRMLGGRS